MAGDRRFNSFKNRAKNKHNLMEIIQSKIKSKTSNEWLKLFTEEGILTSPVNSLGDWLKDPHVNAINAYSEVNQPHLGNIPIASLPGGIPLKGIAPGIGSNAGINFGFGRLILQGLFLAPQMVHESLKGADLIASVFKKLDFMVLPEPKSYRSDIIQAVRLNNSYLIQKVCQSFQNSSPIDSFLNVIPSPMSGYESKLLMSGGTFIEGSTSEFSADAPLRDPYNIFVQGGSHMAHIKIALIQLVFELLEENLIKKESIISS